MKNLLFVSVLLFAFLFQTGNASGEMVTNNQLGPVKIELNASQSKVMKVKIFYGDSQDIEKAANEWLRAKAVGDTMVTVVTVVQAGTSSSYFNLTIIYYEVKKP